MLHACVSFPPPRSPTVLSLSNRQTRRHRNSPHLHFPPCSPSRLISPPKTPLLVSRSGLRPAPSLPPPPVRLPLGLLLVSKIDHFLSLSSPFLLLIPSHLPFPSRQPSTPPLTRRPPALLASRRCVLCSLPFLPCRRLPFFLLRTDALLFDSPLPPPPLSPKHPSWPSPSPVEGNKTTETTRSKRLPRSPLPLRLPCSHSLLPFHIRCRSLAAVLA